MFRRHLQNRDQAFDGIKNFCGEFQSLSVEDPAPNGVMSQHLTFHFLGIGPIGTSGPTFI